MAIVFISKTRKQKSLKRAITTLVIIIMFLVSILMFPPSGFRFPNLVYQGIVQPQEVSLNMSVMDSEKLQSLNPFLPIEAEISSGRQNPFTPYY